MFISPMLLHKVDEPFEDTNYITELKLDGFRTITTKFDNKVRIYTRHNNEITSMFPEIHDISMPNGTVLDGEIIVTDDQGKPDFEAVMERFKSKKSVHEISYSVFDVMYYNDKKITHLPLLERKEILNDIITEDSKLINKVQYIEGKANAYFDLVKQQDLEGIVQKKANSKYQINKRSSDWLKVINYKYETVNISGLRKDEFGLLMTFENGKYAGILEFVTPNGRKEFYSKYRDYVLKEDKKYIYLKPGIKALVKYRNLTKNGLLRIPSYVDWA